jgi:hypothetical protein
MVLSRDTTFLYAAVATNSIPSPLQRFAVTFPSNGAPVFAPQFPYPQPPAGSPVLYDGRFLYSNILGYCSTLEGGVFGCSGGFTLIDPGTLQTAASVITGLPNPSGGPPSSVQSFAVVAAGTLPAGKSGRQANVRCIL